MLKRIMGMSLLLCVAMTICAQIPVLKGSFKKVGIQNHMSETITVGTTDNGSLKTVLQNILKKENDYSFQFGIPEELNGKIVFLGDGNEYYPLYISGKDVVEINVENGSGKLAGNLCKENKVIASWLEITNPLRSKVFTSAGRLTSQEEYHRLVTEMTEKTASLISGIKTGNDSFDAEIKQVLKFITMHDAMRFFEEGISFNRHEDYPAYLQQMFSGDCFADMSIKEYYPFSYELMMLYGFGKHIIYNNEMGAAAELMINDISCPQLRSDFIIESLERGAVWDLDNFVKNNSSKVAADQLPRFNTVVKRLSVNKSGGDWIDFQYADANGKMHSLSDYKGKVVVVDVWATWCAPCKAEIPHLEKLQEEMKGKDVVFISVSFDTDEAAWKKFIKEKSLGGLQLISHRQGPLVDDYKIDAVPRFMVFSKDGKTISTDAPRPSSPDLKALIEKNLKTL
ncbi:MAG: TlpA family protein disulfide reductase [Prevotella sp.]|nr:TlpA family protein disulfide reductase [Prevotella sp.]